MTFSPSHIEYSEEMSQPFSWLQLRLGELYLWITGISFFLIASQTQTRWALSVNHWYFILLDFNSDQVSSVCVWITWYVGLASMTGQHCTPDTFPANSRSSSEYFPQQSITQVNSETRICFCQHIYISSFWFLTYSISIIILILTELLFYFNFGT